MQKFETLTAGELATKYATESHDGGSTYSGAQSNSGQSIFGQTQDNVKVVIRVRPLNEREKSSGSGFKKCVEIQNQSTIILDQRPDYRVFHFDFVGSEDLEQQYIFNSIAKPIVDSCLEGYNGSIFAYGQTGSGKTYTIQGPSITVNGEDQVACTFQKDKSDYEDRGLMPRSFEYVFQQIEAQSKKAKEESSDSSNIHFEYLIRCSYLEIYNEQIMDLLDPSQHNLHIREDIKKGVYVEGLNEEVVSNVQDMNAIITRGASNRHVGSTSMNKESSRSHSVLTTIIESKSMRDGIWNIKTSRFHIIDLAGSERSKHTNAVGDRLKEAGMINKSLSALGNVINSLVDLSEGKSRHIHYRDSKLTFLLRDSLGGNSKTLIIANISPSSLCAGETISTLKFAQRAKLIRNKAVINEDTSGTILILKNEIKRLKKELGESEKRSQQINTMSQYNSNSTQMCAFCKNNVNPNDTDGAGADGDLDESMLMKTTEDFKDLILETGDPLNSSGQQPSSNETVLKNKLHQKAQEVVKQRQRVIFLENLLSANLDNLTSQQKYYDSEMANDKSTIKRLTQNIELYEKQRTRDKMIVKFREDRIAKIEAGQPVTQDDKQHQISELKKELATWKEAVEHNPQAAKLFSEKQDLQKKHDALLKEAKCTPDSQTAQMKGLTEMIESLQEYLKLYNEEAKKEIEEELGKTKIEYAERMEEFTKKQEEYTTKYETKKLKYKTNDTKMREVIETYKVDVEKLKQQLITERDEQEKQSFQKLEAFKIEINQISHNKSEQEQLIQDIKVQLLGKEQHLANLEETLKETQATKENIKASLEQQVVELQAHQEQLKQHHEQQSTELQTKLKDLASQHEVSRKQQHTSAKQETDGLEKQIQSLERDLMREQSERESQNEQIEQVRQTLEQLEKENDQVQQTLQYRDEELSQCRRDLSVTIENYNVLEVAKKMEDEGHAIKLNELHEQLQCLQVQLQQTQVDKNEIVGTLNKQIKTFESKNNDLSKQHSSLLKERELQIDQYETTYQQMNSKLSQMTTQWSEKEQQLANKETEITSLLENIQNLQVQLKTYEAKIQQNADRFALLEQTLSTKSQEHDTVLVEQHQQKEELEQQMGKQIEELSSIIAVKQNQFNLLEAELTTKTDIIQKQIEQIQDLSVKIEQESETVLQLKTNTTKQIEEKEQNIATLNQTINDIQIINSKEMQDLQKESQKIQEQSVQKYKGEIACLKQNINELTQTQQDSIDNKIKQLESDLAIQKENSLAQQTELKNTHEIKISEILAEYETTNAELQGALENKNKEMKIASQNFAQEKSTLQDQINNQLQNINADYNGVIKSMSDKQASLMLDHSAQVTEFQNQIQQNQQEIQNLLYEKCDKQAALDEITSQLKQAQLDIKQQINNKSEMQNQISELQSAIEKAQCNSQSQQNSYSQKIEQLLTDKEGCLNQMEEQLQKQIEAFDQLNQHYQGFAKQKQQELDDLKYMEQTLLSERGQLKSKVAQLEIQVKERISEIAQYQLNLEQLNDKQSELTSQLQMQQMQIQDLQASQNSEAAEMRQEIDELSHSLKEMTSQAQKYKQKSDEMTDMLVNSKQAITSMIEKETNIQTEFEQKMTEYKDNQEKSKNKLQQIQGERDNIVREWERNKKETEHFRDLVKLKDKQIEEQLKNNELQEKEQFNKYIKENKDLKNQVSKRDFEVKEIIKTLKFYSEEKSRLEKELEKLYKENEGLIGHKNPSQKIQHHLKIKEENNKLREDNIKLQEDLRKKLEQNTKLIKQLADCGQQVPPQLTSSALNQMQSPVQQPQQNSQTTQQLDQTYKEDIKKLRKENITYQETINRLVDHVLSQPTLLKIVGISEEMTEKINSAGGGTNKVKHAMEIVSLFSNVLQQKEKELKDVNREKKKIECKLDIVDKEKNLCKQQLELIQQTGTGGNASGYMQKSTLPSYQASAQQLINGQGHTNGFTGHTGLANQSSQDPTGMDDMGIQAATNLLRNNNHSSYIERGSLDAAQTTVQHHQLLYKKPSLLMADKFIGKEKENLLGSKRDILLQGVESSQRSGSNRRAVFLSNGGNSGMGGGITNLKQQ